MRCVSHLACTICGTTFSAETPWQERRFAWSPEGAATLAAIPELVDRGFIRPGNRVVLVNTASAEKYLPALRTALDGGL
jgi:threonine synthase